MMNKIKTTKKTIEIAIDEARALKSMESIEKFAKARKW